MNLFAIVAEAATLPPPPSPTANNPVSPLSIVLVVVIVLGSVAMIALSSRRFRHQPSATPDEAKHSAPAGNGSTPTPSGRSGTEPAVAKADPDLLARLRRVTGSSSAERRRLGDRRPKDAAEPAPAPASWAYPVEEPDASELAPDESIESTAHAPEPDVSPEPELLNDESSVDERPLPEPIPIRRRSMTRDVRRWQDEPVITSDPTAAESALWRDDGSGGTMPGLTTEEIAQLAPPLAKKANRVHSRSGSPLALKRPIETQAPQNDEERLLNEISATVRELLFCANVGELLHGFALYSDPFLFRTMDESGLTEEEFRSTFAAQPAKPVSDWTRIGEVVDLVRESSERVSATVKYLPPASGAEAGAERFCFVRNPYGDGWLIDDISPASE